MINVKMLTIAETAANYGISQYAVRKWVNSGALPAVRIGKKFLINEQVIESFLKGESVPAPAHGKNEVCEIKPIDVRGFVR